MVDEHRCDSLTYRRSPSNAHDGKPSPKNSGFLDDHRNAALRVTRAYASSVTVRYPDPVREGGGARAVMRKRRRHHQSLLAERVEHEDKWKEFGIVSMLYEAKKWKETSRQISMYLWYSLLAKLQSLVLKLLEARLPSSRATPSLELSPCKPQYPLLFEAPS
eukprot:IDg15381t1